MVVVVRDANGQPVPNQTITWVITGGAGGSLSATAFTGSVVTTCTGGTTCTSVTDANGRAAVGFVASLTTPGTSFSQTNISASTGAQSVNFIQTTYLAAVNNQPASAPISELQKPGIEDRNIVGQAGQTITDAVRVRVIAAAGPQQGTAVPNVGLSVSTLNQDPALGPTAMCQGGPALTDGTGVASCNLVLGGRIGATQVTVNVGGQTNLITLNLTVNAGPPGLVRILGGNNQSGNAGQRLPLAFVAQITDAFGNPLAGTQVQFEIVTPNSITLENLVNVSDFEGRVSALGRLGQIGGTHQVRLTAGSATGTFTFTVNQVISGLSIVSGNNQSAQISQAFPAPLVVQATSQQGPVAGAQVSFTVASGSASLSAATATTNASGQASVNVTAGATAGPITITAAIAGTSFSQTFTLTSRPPAPVFTAANVVNTFSGLQGVTPGGFATITGSGFAQGISGTVVGFGLAGGPMPLTLNDVEVTFDGLPAPIAWISNINGVESITVQVPTGLTSPGTTTVAIRRGAGTTPVSGIPVFRVQPGIFETGPANQRYGLLLRPNGTFVTPENPAQRGEILTMFAAGLGPARGPGGQGPVTNQPGNANQQVEQPVIVGVNDAGVRVVSATLAPNLIGVYLVQFEVPLDTTPGPNRPLGLLAQDPSGNLIFANGSVIAALQ
jgi:uncharacterized protein (TIGR03437 family)